MVVRAYNPITWKAKAGGSLKPQGKHGFQNEFKESVNCKAKSYENKYQTENTLIQV